MHTRRGWRSSDSHTRTHAPMQILDDGHSDFSSVNHQAASQTSEGRRHASTVHAVAFRVSCLSPTRLLFFDGRYTELNEHSALPFVLVVSLLLSPSSGSSPPVSLLRWRWCVLDCCCCIPVCSIRFGFLEPVVADRAWQRELIRGVQLWHSRRP